MRPGAEIEFKPSPEAEDLKLPARLLFRFSAPCRYATASWSREGVNLAAEYRLPDLHALEAGRPGFADFRMGWNEGGLLLSVWMKLGQPLPPARTRNADGGDGIDLWIDTRDVHDVHRATRYCHRFFFRIEGRNVEASAAVIQNSRGKPKAIDDKILRALLVAESDRYRIDGFIPAAALTGYDPVEHPRLGFNYSVRHRSWGEQTFSSGSPLPFRTDPSLWATLDLTPLDSPETG